MTESRREPLVLKVIEAATAGRDAITDADVVRVTLNRNVMEGQEARGATVTMLVPLEEARQFYPVGELLELVLVPHTESKPQEAAQ